MMSGLMYKNFLLYRLEWILLAVFQLLVSMAVIFTWVTSNGSPAGNLLMYFFLFVISGIVESNLFASEEKTVSRNFLLSLPSGLKGHIESKYYFFLIVNLILMNCCFLTDTVCFALTGDQNTMSTFMLLLMFSAGLFIDALSLPFTVAFGANYGMYAKAATMGVILLAVLVYALFGDISYFVGNDFIAVLNALFSDEDILLFMALIPYGSVLLYWLSCKLSIVLYQKGAENYDQ